MNLKNRITHNFVYYFLNSAFIYLPGLQCCYIFKLGNNVYRLMGTVPTG